MQAVCLPPWISPYLMTRKNNSQSVILDQLQQHDLGIYNMCEFSSPSLDLLNQTLEVELSNYPTDNSDAASSVRTTGLLT